jgi:hypothetical protein
MTSIRNARKVWAPRRVLPWIWVTLAVVLGYFLITEHRAHLFGALPYLLVLLCPLMHLFMHHGHGGHDHGASQSPREDLGREVRP